MIALAGNPNVGKTTLFNRLTGLRQKVGNYPGVTVEKKVGQMRLPSGRGVEVLDVPGTYSLTPRSLDERIAFDALTGKLDGTEAPSLIVVVADASNLERNLYFASQVMDLGTPVVLALNLMDHARASGLDVRPDMLQEALGVPVVPLVAATGEGVDALLRVLDGPPPAPAPRAWALPPAVAAEVDALAATLGAAWPTLSEGRRFSEALRSLVSDWVRDEWAASAPAFHAAVGEARARLQAAGDAYEHAEVIGRYGWLTPLAAQAVRRPSTHRVSVSDRLDAVLTHPVWGLLVFFGLLAVLFQSIFTWAAPAMDGLEALVALLGGAVTGALPPGPVRNLLVEGVVAGVGGVVVFLPQILLLFLFLGLLEDTGYMARAAFLMDRAMSKVGLSGRSVVPLLSSFACAIPGVMATRTIDNPRDRLVTILVAPLMSCSARLPVYTLFIGAFIPPTAAFGLFGWQGLTMLALYLLGVGMAIGAAWILKRFVIRGEQALFVMELPPYRLPRWRNVLWQMLERARLFLVRAGGLILAISVVIWFLSSYPTPPDDASATPTAEAANPLAYSYLGRAGHALEPAIAPLGFDWKMGIGLLTSFAAREVIVATLGTIYAVGDDVDETSTDLRDRLRADPAFSPLVAVSLLVFFVLAMQCMSTLAVVKRETNSWRWPLFMWTYMTALAYLMSLLVYQGGRALGFG